MKQILTKSTNFSSPMPTVAVPTTPKSPKISPGDRHKSVLTKEVIEYLAPQKGGTYLDATFGTGGHSRAILEAEPTCTVIALDWDKEALERHGKKLKEEFGNRIQFIWANFGALYKLFKKKKITTIDGIVADFGTSQFQIHHKDGFSFLRDTPLDMRMSPAHHYFKASDIINRFTENHLAKILWEFGEERQAKKIARAIVTHRQTQKIGTTHQLARLIEKTLATLPAQKKNYRIHPATKTFQALRIFVNKELDNIEEFLVATIPFLSPGARLVCISFHSLEDRIVKNFFRNSSEHFETITPKPITAQQEEVKKNRSARSAKLRVGSKRST